MPNYGLITPGKERHESVDIAETYTITVERNDGIACTDIEAWTAMSVFCMKFIPKSKKHRKRKSANKQITEEAS